MMAVFLDTEYVDSGQLMSVGKLIFVDANG
ncbi:MAG: hypothetical protein JWO89_763, partial [Verrucomicrobiaceae bacterium]|nr:hypothetical protein [Verrucomicrobiaceae bacterium]